MNLNVHMNLKFIYWNPIPQCDDFWRWELWEIIRFRCGHEKRVLTIEVIVRRDTRAPSLSFPLYHIKTQKEDGYLQSRKRSLTRNHHTLILYFWPPKNVRKQISCFLSHHNGIQLCQPKQTKAICYA